MDKDKLDVDTKAEMEFWDAFSEDYDKYFEAPNLQTASTLARMLQITKSKSILEIGCGPGRLTEQVVPHLSPGSKYVALDLSEKMINYAKSRVQKLNLSKDIDVQLIQGNAQDLSQFKDEQFDIVIAPLIVHVVPHPDKVLSEARRVLKSGGRFGCSVLGESQLNTYFHVRDAFVELGHLPESKEEEGIFYLGKKKALVDKVSKNGFEVSYCWQQDGLVEVFSDEDMIQQVKDNFQYKGILAGLKEDDQKVVTNKVLDIFHGFQERKDPLVINSTALIATKK